MLMERETRAKTRKRPTTRDKASSAPVLATDDAPNALGGATVVGAADAPDDLDDLDYLDEITPARRKPTERAARPHSKKRKLHWSFLVAGLAVVGAIIYLVVANTGTTAEYYMTIKELRGCSSCQSQNVRVLGNVAPNSVVTNTQTQVVRFTITQGAETLPVVYGGIVPDTFKSGLQVVVEGHMVNGVFQAQTLLAKCPSRFQAAPTHTGK